MRPRLLDLFCGAGGAAMGYHRAGFDVVGVDINPQPHYPFEFHQGDAMTWPLDGFDAIHASPPCQAYSPHVTSRSSEWVPTLGKDEPALISTVRQRLADWGGVYVIENVMGARSEFFWPARLCGTSFGLPIHRHRIFGGSEIMGIDWPTTQHELAEAIPPAYTEWIGAQLLAALRVSA